MQCRSCGYAGPPPVEVQTQLERGNAALKGLDIRQRQLGQLHRFLLASSLAGMGCLGVFFALSTIGLGFFALLGLLMLALAGPGSSIVYMLTSPLIIFFLGAIPALAFFSQQRRKFQLICAALPPQINGEPAGCHICGADLPRANGKETLVRCQYCQADNLVDVTLIEKASSARRTTIDDYAEAIKREGLEVGVSATAAAGAVLVWPIASFMGGLILASFIQKALDVIEKPANTKERHILLQSTAGACVGRVNMVDSSGVGTVVVDLPTPPGIDLINHVSAVGNANLNLQSLVGKRAGFRTHNGTTNGKVLRLFSTQAMPSTVFAQVKQDNGEENRFDITSACFLEPIANAQVFTVTKDKPKKSK